MGLDMFEVTQLAKTKQLTLGDGHHEYKAVEEEEEGDLKRPKRADGEQNDEGRIIDTGRSKVKLNYWCFIKAIFDVLSETKLQQVFEFS